MSDPYDYSQYSLKELLEIQSRVDRDAYPDRADQIDSWVQTRREEMISDSVPAETVSFEAPIGPSTSSLLVGCGITIVGAFTIVVSIMGVLLFRSLTQAEEAKRFATSLTEQIVTSWDPTILAEAASSELTADTDEDELESLFALFRRLGELERLQEPEGSVSANLILGRSSTSLQASYQYPATFSNGDARIRIDIVRQDVTWRVSGFRIDSELFLTLESTGQ